MYCNFITIQNRPYKVYIGLQGRTSCIEKNDICSNLLSQWVRYMGYPDPIIIIFEGNVYCFFLSSDETNNGIRPLLKGGLFRFVRCHVPYLQHIVACHLPRAPKLRWREDMGGGLQKARKPRTGYSLQPTGLQRIHPTGFPHV